MRVDLARESSSRQARERWRAFPEPETHTIKALGPWAFYQPEVLIPHSVTAHQPGLRPLGCGYFLAPSDEGSRMKSLVWYLNGSFSSSFSWYEGGLCVMQCPPYGFLCCVRAW